MILADTSVWIEFLKKNFQIFSVFKSHLEIGNILASECIFSELLQGVKNKREKRIVLEYWNNLPKIDETGIWIEAGIYSNEHKLYSKGIGLIDCVILLVAQKTKSKLWTLDKKLLSILIQEEIYTPLT